MNWAVYCHYTDKKKKKLVFERQVILSTQLSENIPGMITNLPFERTSNLSNQFRKNLKLSQVAI